jgi:hypothetical protein
MKLACLCLTSVLALGACSSSDKAAPEEETRDIVDPTIVVDSPLRGTMTEDGLVLVTGHVSDEGSGVAQVEINGQLAELAADGSFSASVSLEHGITMLQSVVSDVAGNQSDDLRAILNGPMVPQGTPVPDAIIAKVNAKTLGVLESSVESLVESVDFGQVAQPLNPLVDAGNSCAGVKVDLNTAEKSKVTMALLPTNNGIEVEVIMHDLDVDMTADYSIGCFGGGASGSVNISASSARATATLDVSIDAGGEIQVDLSNVNTSFVDFDLDVGGLPEVIVNLFNGTVESKVRGILEDQVQTLVPSTGKEFLAEFTSASWSVPVLSDTLNVSIAPTSVDISEEGIALRVEANTEFAAVEGASYLSSPRPPPMAGSNDQGLNVGIADDLGNQLLASLWASGLLEANIQPLLVEHMQALFGETADDIRVELALPPIISPDPANNAVRLSIGDLLVHVGDGSTTLVEFAISADIDLAVTNEGGTLKLTTDAASVYGKLIELSDEVALNVNDATVAAIADIAIREISGQSDGLLDAIPIPSFGAIMLGLPEVRAADGYLMLDADITGP